MNWDLYYLKKQEIRSLMMKIEYSIFVVKYYVYVL